jgi:hypothetical protein
VTVRFGFLACVRLKGSAVFNDGGRESELGKAGDFDAEWGRYSREIADLAGVGGRDENPAQGCRWVQRVQSSLRDLVDNAFSSAALQRFAIVKVAPRPDFEVNSEGSRPSSTGS